MITVHIKRISRAVCLFCALAALTGCSQQIPPAAVGIKFSADDGYSQQILKPEVVWVGWRQQLVIFPTSIHNATYVKNAREGDKAEDDSIMASTIEGAQLPVDVTVAWHVAPENAVLAFQQFGTEDMGQVQKEFIRWVAIDAVNEVSGTKSIFDITSKQRASFGPDIKKVIAPELIKWGISVDDVYIGEVYPSPEISAKINEVITLKNSVALATNDLQKADIDARSLIQEAKAEAARNKMLAIGNNTALDLKRRDIRRKAIAKWDGETPLNGDGKIPFTSISIDPMQSAPPRK